VFDGELGSAARRVSDPAYKAHRAGGEAALPPIRALPDVKRGLEALKISWIEEPGGQAARGRRQGASRSAGRR
jgi:DNA polymerase I